MSSNDAGGSAAAGGFDYQHRGVAWIAVQILAGKAAAPHVKLWSSPLVRVDCETGEGVDDSRTEQLDGAPVVTQYKRTLTLSTGAESDLGKTVTQFVRQHRLPDRHGDSLVLATGPGASGTVRNDLRDVLDRLRESPPTKSARR